METYKIVAASLLCSVLFASCEGNKKQDKDATKTTATTEVADTLPLKKEDFTADVDGKKVSLYYIKAKNINVAFTNYGARIVGLWVPDKYGKMTDVVVGLGSTKAYQNSTELYFGATIGRVGNRIAKGAFKIDGKEYHVPLNNGANSLHGGKKGFQDVVWDVTQPDEKTLVFTYHSPDGEEGFPGNLDVTKRLTLHMQMFLLGSYPRKTCLQLIPTASREERGRSLIKKGVPFSRALGQRDIEALALTVNCNQLYFN